MAELALRPRYRFVSNHSHKTLSSALQNALSSQHQFNWNHAKSHMIVSMARPRKHFWSPEMDISFDELDSGQSGIRILIGPAAGIWTLFMFLYTAASVMAIGGLVLGYSQQVLDQQAWGWWFVPAAMVMAGFIYIAGRYGRYRARCQMHELKYFFDQALPDGYFNEEEDCPYQIKEVG